jgi:hypothetical protein
MPPAHNASLVTLKWFFPTYDVRGRDLKVYGWANTADRCGLS